jgi:ubiquinone/menaquinone biosynthesis C-methylase UbiE
MPPNPEEQADKFEVTGERKRFMDTDAVVLESYSRRILDPEVAPGFASEQLCSAEGYDRDLLRNVPAEIINADFGCGNPSKYARAGDVVLDLGSGGGKICYILSQIVGASGKVIGVDMNRDMLALARAHQAGFAAKVGFDNISFLLGRIQDMGTDLEALDAALAQKPIDGIAGYLETERALRQAASERPLVADGSVDLIVSNCVINLVRTGDKASVFHEMFRVLREGGRIAISDIVSNIELPEELRNDPELWAKCYGGVFQEQELYAVLEYAGFTAIRIEVRRELPDRSIGDVRYSSVTLTALKPHVGKSCCGGSSARREVLYLGPWKEVIDDQGIHYRRGEPTGVADWSWKNLAHGSYRDEIVRIGEPASAEPGPSDQKDEASCCS